MKKSFWLLVLVILLLPIFAFADSNPDLWIQTDKDIYAYGEEIRVHFSNAPGYSSDWICIAPQGSPDTYAGDYNNMSAGLVEGVMIFKSPLPGNYEVRAYYSYSPFRYTVSARYPFTVAQEDYGYIDGGYYDAPITYGEPCYYPPPIAVTFAFDYFTYELAGSYIDIVFWRGGHRYHRKPWHDHGKWVTKDYIHSGQWHNKISGDDLLRHRDNLKEHNNIVHPDSYYGVKPGHQIKTGQGNQVSGKKPQPDMKQIPHKIKLKQWDRKSPQQTPKMQVRDQQPSGRKSLQQNPNNQVSGQPSSQIERKTDSRRESSSEKEKQSGESSGKTENKKDSNREKSQETDNQPQSQSGWGGRSQQSDNHSQWGNNSSGQAPSREKNNDKNDKKGRW